jgi:hypothetical protein
MQLLKDSGEIHDADRRSQDDKMVMMHGTRPDNHIKAPPGISDNCSSDMLWERAQTLPMEVPYEIVRGFRLAFKQQLLGSP